MSFVVAQSHFIFGVRTGVRNNLCFFDEQTVVFPSGNSCVCFNTVQRWQRFISGSERSQGMRAMTISSNRRYLAVSDYGERATVTVFDLQHEQGRKRKVLSAGDMSVQEFICIAFSPDSKYLIGLTGSPEWMLILWLWEKHKLLATLKTTNTNNPVTQVSFNPYSNTQLCVSGTGVFKLFRYSEGALKPSSVAKVESINFLCHTWVSEHRVIAGTDTGRLLVFESGDLRREISMTCVQGQPARQVEVKKIKDANVNEGPSVPSITAILSYSKGFACSRGPGTVFLFEQTDENGYRKTREIKIPLDAYCSGVTLAEYQQIDTICISPAEETLAISTNRGQLYSVCLSSVDMNKEDKLHFEFLSQSFHSSSITGLSICIRKPLVATCSLDRSVRIWNYETKVLELCKEFQEEAYSVALHPTGLFILVGFSDRLRLMNLLIDDIRTFKEFTVRSCRECAFSNGGHMFAAVNGNIIQIYSVTSFDNILNLKGHNGKVCRIEWSLDDSRVVSCGVDGAVYEWNTQSGKRESESVLKSCSYTGVAFSSDCKTILAVGTDLTLKEIQDCQVLREVPADETAHTALAVSHSGRVVFTGTSSGTVRAIKYPLPIQKEWMTYQAHSGPVTKMVITYDDQFLLTVSEDGCLLIWKIIDKEGRGLKSNKHIVHTEEILITKSDLEEKTQHMLEMKMRLEELQMENEYQLRLKDMNYNEKLRELSDNFVQQIESLKTSQQTEMEKQECENQQNSAELIMKHSKELKDLELSYSQKLIVEHEKYQDLQQKHQRMQEDYEKQLKSAEDRKIQAVEELTKMYEAKLQEKAELLAQCQEDTEQKISVFKAIIKQAEEDEERKILEIQTNYEKKMKTEKQTNTNLKGKNSIMAQKFISLQKQIDDRSADINKLKQERQRLLGLIRSLESDIEDLKRQISGHEKTSQDKDHIISCLKRKNQELEKLKFVLEFQLNELKQKTEPLQHDINVKKERISQLEEELIQTDKSNAQLKLTVSELKLKLKTRDKEMCKESQKVKDLETHLQRLKSDLHNCVGFIQEPKTLKDNIQMIYARYVQQTERVERTNADDTVQKALRHQCDRQERTVNGLKMRLVKSAEEHEKVYTKIMKENMTLIAEINELRKELHLARTQAKDVRAQLALLKKPKKSQPILEEAAYQEPKQLGVS
ncbi:cilia- and flagella-associated protein 57 isoform X2 [Astatotilapia calliptera]|uniref:cilia- and flagella-associated protein 57 isoform X2 n=1 Tax=Astatotilapia calliptera TaxID=8154 RepID=UPI000E403337|nr:cilia- and flagella-associated protein 57 isoform X2 [Astatotilapia calliptera]